MNDSSDWLENLKSVFSRPAPYGLPTGVVEGISKLITLYEAEQRNGATWKALALGKETRLNQIRDIANTRIIQ